MTNRALATWVLCLGLAGCASNGAAADEEGAASSPAATHADDDPAAPPEPADVQAPPPTSSPPRALPSTHDYRTDYPELPDMGEAQEYFRAHGRRTQIDRGFFRGPLRLAGAGLTKEGAGATETVIDGDVELAGDRWVLRELTITGDLTIRGDANDLAGCEVLGRVDVMGSNNKRPPGR